MCHSTVMARELAGVSSLFQPHESWKSNSGHQVDVRCHLSGSGWGSLFVSLFCFCLFVFHLGDIDEQQVFTEGSLTSFVFQMIPDLGICMFAFWIMGHCCHSRGVPSWESNTNGLVEGTEMNHSEDGFREHCLLYFTGTATSIVEGIKAGSELPKLNAAQGLGIWAVTGNIAELRLQRGMQRMWGDSYSWVKCLNTGHGQCGLLSWVSASSWCWMWKTWRREKLIARGCNLDN